MFVQFKIMFAVHQGGKCDIFRKMSAIIIQRYAKKRVELLLFVRSPVMRRRGDFD